MKHILKESYTLLKRKHSLDPSRVQGLKQVLVNDEAFSDYVSSLAESLTPNLREGFAQLAENTRVNLLETSSMNNLTPYETLTLPILRVFYPKLVAKEAITVSPMDKPECVKGFLTATFTQANSSTEYAAPSVTTDISGGPSIGDPITATMAVPQSDYDVLAVASLTKTQAHIERDFEITGVSADGTNYTTVSIIPAVEGHFSSSVTITGSGTDVVSGKVDYLNGTVAVSSSSGVVTYIKYKCTCTLEENRVNPTANLSIDKVRLNAKDRQIQANWTINMEQDMRSLFDLSIQSELVNILGQQIALDIDREIVAALNTANTTFNTSTHTGSFNRTPPTTYIWGPKHWHENILPELNQLSAQIYNDTHMGQGNVILANPLDVAILEDINSFAYTGTSSDDGDLGYRSATVAGGKWKILTSAIVTQGTMTMVYKPVEELKSVYIYAPYIPAVLHPYPLAQVPSMTILSRYATANVRPKGIATLTIGA